MSFNGAGVPEAQERVGKLIKPGVTQAVIHDISYIESTEKKTPGIEITLMTKPIEGLKDTDGNTIGQKSIERLWMSPKAWDNNGDIKNAMWSTKARLSIIADKLGCREQYDAINSTTAAEFVTAVTPLFKGKKARWAFGGEEKVFTNDKGENIKFVNPVLLTFKFIESLTEIPNDDATKLKYDETDAYHFKKLEVADDANQDAVGQRSLNKDVSTDLPW